jgi:hypothetical protein
MAGIEQDVAPNRFFSLPFVVVLGSLVVTAGQPQF